VRLHVAGAARISIITPRSANIARALEDNKVLNARLLQTDGRAQAAEAAANNRDARVERGMPEFYLVTSGLVAAKKKGRSARLANA
jgi:hypothetical protein